MKCDNCKHKKYYPNKERYNPRNPLHYEYCVKDHWEKTPQHQGYDVDSCLDYGDKNG
jgi:hypothetical protein